MDTFERIFQDNQRLVFAIAYRMLGSASDAEDIVQDTFIQFNRIPIGDVRNPQALLATIATRTAIDRSRLAYRKREEYPGPWLPEPILTLQGNDPIEGLEREEFVSQAFLLALDRLSPLDRAVFLLRDVFDFDYTEIASIVEKTAENCRKINERARIRVREDRSVDPPSPARKDQLLAKFLSACAGGNLDELVALLHEDAIFYSDGGGRVAAALNPIFGAISSAKLIFGLNSRYAREGVKMRARFANINGSEGYLLYLNGKLDTAMTLEFEGNRVRRIYSVRNPEKLSFLKSQISSRPIRFFFANLWMNVRLLVANCK